MAEKNNVTARVVGYIRGHIADGSWPVGSKLPSEHEFCQALGVSRVSVRAALQRFIALDILESQHGRGTFVRSDDLDALGHQGAARDAASLVEVLEFRLLIEPEIAAQAAGRATDELVERLEELLKEMSAHKRAGSAFVDSDLRFHQTICDSLGNSVTSEMMASVLRQRATAHEQVNLSLGYYGGVYYHTLLLEAFRRRDPRRARAVMREHLEKGIEELMPEEPGTTE